MAPAPCVRPALVLERLLARRLHQAQDPARRLAPPRPGHDLVSRRGLGLSSPHLYQAKLTPAEVTTILRANEYTNNNLEDGPVKSFDTNTLQSNSPIEDSHAEAFLKSKSGGLLFGIMDGHGGAACGQVVAKRLFHYIAAGLLSPKELSDHIDAIEHFLKSGKVKDSSHPDYHIVRNFSDHFEIVEDLQELYHESYFNYLHKLKKKRVEIGNNDQINDVEDILIDSFLSLDNDMSDEASEKKGGQINMKTVTVAMSGCVAAAAYIEGPHLSVASTGDCTAVVGSLSDTDTWLAKKLTTEHNSDNQKEVKRILAEHPENEHHHIIKGDRLLSVLAPLRAFGDFKFKWSTSTVVEILGSVMGEHAVLPNYKTPPYLTARPEVTYHRLTPRDKFLVIGSDGLWDMMTPMQVSAAYNPSLSQSVFAISWLIKSFHI